MRCIKPALLILPALLMTGCALLDRSPKSDKPTAESLDRITVELSAEEQLPPPETGSLQPEPTDPPPDSTITYKSPQHQQQATAAQAKFKRAVRDIKKGQLDSAYQQLTLIKQSYPDLISPVTNMAIILRQQGKFQDAYDLLMSHNGADSEDIRLLNELGIISRHLGKFDQARSSYESAIRVDPNYAKAHYNLAVLADLYLHDPELALTEFRIYQSLLNTPDKKVNGWIIELERRTQSNN